MMRVLAGKIRGVFLGPRRYETHVAEAELGGLRAKFELRMRADEVRLLQIGSERDYVEKMMNAVEPSDVFYDVGTYFGLVAIFVALRGARVVAVEPDPACCARTQLHFGMNPAVAGKVELIRAGLSDTEGELTLNTGGDVGDAPSFFARGLEGSLKVPVRKLDDLAEELGQPTVLKVDVEGFERRVLMGGRKVLANPALRLIFLEVHPVLMTRNGESLAELFSMIESAGFRYRECALRKDEMHMILERP